MATYSPRRLQRSGKKTQQSYRQFLVFAIAGEQFALPIESIYKVIQSPQIYGDPNGRGLGLVTHQEQQVVVLDIEQFLFGISRLSDAPSQSSSLNSAQFLILMRIDRADGTAQLLGIPVEQAPLLQRLAQQTITALPESYMQWGDIHGITSVSIQDVEQAEKHPTFILEPAQVFSTVAAQKSVTQPQLLEAEPEDAISVIEEEESEIFFGELNSLEDELEEKRDTEELAIALEEQVDTDQSSLIEAVDQNLDRSAEADALLSEPIERLDIDPEDLEELLLEELEPVAEAAVISESASEIDRPDEEAIDLILESSDLIETAALESLSTEFEEAVDSSDLLANAATDFQASGSAVEENDLLDIAEQAIDLLLDEQSELCSEPENQATEVIVNAELNTVIESDVIADPTKNKETAAYDLDHLLQEAAVVFDELTHIPEEVIKQVEHSAEDLADLLADVSEELFLAAQDLELLSEDSTGLRDRADVSNAILLDKSNVIDDIATLAELQPEAIAEPVSQVTSEKAELLDDNLKELTATLHSAEAEMAEASPLPEMPVDLSIESSNLPEITSPALDVSSEKMALDSTGELPAIERDSAVSVPSSDQDSEDRDPPDGQDDMATDPEISIKVEAEAEQSIDVELSLDAHLSAEVTQTPAVVEPAAVAPTTGGVSPEVAAQFQRELSAFSSAFFQSQQPQPKPQEISTLTWITQLMLYFVCSPRES